MKNLKLMKALSLADDKYIKESDINEIKAKRKHKRITFGALAACFVLIFTAVNVWLFMPHKEYIGDISAHTDSEYYSIIEKLNVYGITPPKYKNNFIMFFDGLTRNFLATKGEDFAPGDGAPQEYKEVTDNQVEGVIEGDRIKRSDKYIYYLSEGNLLVYEIGKESLEPIESLSLSQYDNIEFYLSKDCTKITLICEYFSDGYSIVRVTLIDTSNPTALHVEKHFDVRGSYISSRVIDGKLILTTQFNVRTNPDYSDEKNFVPQYDMCDGKGFQSIAAESIVAPGTLDSSNYTVLFMLDDQKLSLYDSFAFLSYSEELYVSQSNIYISRGYTEKAVSGGINDKTDISSLSYTSSKFSYKKTYTLDGRIKDQYSLDEKDGILRVVTTTSSNAKAPELPAQKNASLYCINTESGDILASVENFAPKGESVYSVRFEENSAYVCTALYVAPMVFDDPVYFFDLSDLSNITYTETGSIAGYSSSLIDLGEDYLLGVGTGDNGVFKIAIYTEENGKVVTVCEHTENLYRNYSESYKSYLIDRENNLFGLALSDAQRFGETCYALFQFDGYRIKTLYFAPLKTNGTGSFIETKDVRACIIDGYIYIFADDTLTIEKIF